MPSPSLITRDVLSCLQMLTHDVWKVACPSQMDCHSSLQAVNQEPYPGPTQMNHDNAPLSPLETFENFNPMQPFFQEDYPSQRFRPQKRELCEEQKCDVYDPYYSPPETFMPSESSDAISVELPKTNTSQSVERLITREPSSNKSTQGSRTEVESQAAETLVELRRGGSTASIPCERTIIGLEKVAMGRNHPQPFSQAEMQRVREWNNQEIDDRWDLKVGEVYTNTGRLLHEGDPHWHRWVTLASVDTEVEHYISKEKKAELDMQKLANEWESMKDPQQRELMEKKRLAERERIYTPPPDEARLEHFICELDTGSEPLPPGIHNNRDVIRKWFEERVFSEDEHPMPICDERANKFTTYRGGVTTFKALRENILRDINDLVDFIFSPAGEETRESMKTRISHRPASPLRSVDSPNAVGVSEHLPRQPFAEQLAAISIHNSKRDQSQSQESLTTNSPIDQRHQVRSKRSHEEANSRVAIDEPDMIREEAATLGKVHVNRLDALNMPQSKYYVVTPTITNVTTAAANSTATTIPAASLPKMNDPNMIGSTRVSHLLPSDTDGTMIGSTRASHLFPSDTDGGQPRMQQFLFGAAPQHLQFGVYPGSVYLNSPLASQLPHVGQMQQPWLIQSPAGTFHQPNYSVLQAMPYGYPGQTSYAQPNPGYQGFQQFPVSQQGYFPPPMPSGREVRPPAPGRVARMSTLTEAFGTPTSIQGRTLPTSLTRNTEWRNRYSPQPPVIPDLPMLPYRVGSDTMYPRATGAASVRFQRLIQSHPPSLHDVTLEGNLPFTANAKLSKPAEWGVMKIGNIPYDLTKEALLNFLGPHAKIITNDLGPPIHIIMDRSTGKTMDCFVEFFSTPDARACINSILLRSVSQNRIGDRVVEVMLSGQEELMTELFPKAKNVKWQGAKPVIKEATELFNSGFKAFVSLEELGCLVRHAEQPHRSNYTQRSPQRTYESLISLLAKFPWSDVAHYTVATRTHIFQTTRQMLHILTINVHKTYNSPASNSSSLIQNYGLGYGNDWSGHNGWPVLTEALLHDLLMAALNAPGFSEKQRWELFEISGYARSRFRVSPLLQYWPFEVLGRKPNMEEDVVELYAAIISRHHVNAQPENIRFGDFKHIMNQMDLDSRTMDSAGDMEWMMLHELLRGALEEIAEGR